MKPLHVSTATASGGRNGRVTSDDGTIDLATSLPRGLGGDGAAGTNPEQLFAAGYAACFGSAVALVARMQRIEVGQVEVTAQVTIGRDEVGLGLEVELRVRVGQVSEDQARALVEAAHVVCPYSRATRGNVPVTLTVLG